MTDDFSGFMDNGQSPSCTVRIEAVNVVLKENMIIGVGNFSVQFYVISVKKDVSMRKVHRAVRDV